MINYTLRVAAFFLLISILCFAQQEATDQQAASFLSNGERPHRAFQIEEATITDIHDALKAKAVTCQELARRYLDRIEAYDKQGPSVNSIITINPRALERARELDVEFAARGLTGPLHCIPVIVKDNFNTEGLATSAGSLALAGSVPAEDSFQVRKIKEAGAIVLAKANMSEFALSGDETVSSRLPGYTKNPYALERVTAGSSGGTAAAVAANFGAVGLGSDTEDSIRGPSSHTSLVGIRSTMGLTSRSGIVPLDLSRDIGGPMARTVADGVAVFDVVAGPDPADQVTEVSHNKIPSKGYMQFLDKKGLRGGRIGVLRFRIEPKNSDADVVRLFDRAVAELKAQGANLVDPLDIPELASPAYESSVYAKAEELVWTTCSPMKFELRDYLANLGSRAPVHSLQEILKTGKFHPSLEYYLRAIQAVSVQPRDNPECEAVRTEMRELPKLMEKVFAEHKLDAVVYPSWSIPPRVIGDLNTPDGMNSGLISPPAGFPAITVPMGYARGSLPVGLEFLGLAWSEPTLFRYAYSYEQASRLRRPPATTPPLPKN